ncbi:MAG: hypothetical protein Q4Q53_08565 [Methanocorpusculum sp.]|nr:hypothetical protein [Methanocorpusculum sp.]
MNRVNNKIILITAAVLLLSLLVCGVLADDSTTAGIIKNASNGLVTVSGDVRTVESDVSNVITLNNNINVNSPNVYDEITYVASTIDRISANSKSVSDKLEPVRSSLSEIALNTKYPPEGLFTVSAGVNNIASELGKVPSDLSAVSAELIEIANKAENLSEYPTEVPTETPAAVETRTPSFYDDGNPILPPDEESSYVSQYSSEETPEIDYSAYYTSENLSSDLAKVSAELETIKNNLNNAASNLILFSAQLSVIANELDSSIPVEPIPTETATPDITSTETVAPTETVTPTETDVTFVPTGEATPDDNTTVPAEEDNTFGTVLIFIIIGAAAVAAVIVVVIVLRKKNADTSKKRFDELSARLTQTQTAPVKTEKIEEGKEPEEEYTAPFIEEVKTTEPVKVENVREFSLSDADIPIIEVYRIVAKSISKRYGIKNICTFTPKQMTALVKEPTAELKEFTELYEIMKYSQDAEPQDKERLISLAEIILRQYRS